MVRSTGTDTEDTQHSTPRVLGIRLLCVENFNSPFYMPDLSNPWALSPRAFVTLYSMVVRLCLWVYKGPLVCPIVTL